MLYIVGTGLAIAMTMIMAVVYYVKIAPVYPAVSYTHLDVYKRQVQLDLYEVPFQFVVAGEQVVKDFDVSMIGESEVADASGFALFQQDVQHLSLIHIWIPEGVP